VLGAPLTSARAALRVVAAVLLAGCVLRAAVPPAPAPLGAWRDGEARRRIVRFVEEVTTPGGADFVPPAERVAAFDLDGTLWVERPRYIAVEFELESIRARAEREPALRSVEPYRAVYWGDLRWLERLDPRKLFTLFINTHADVPEAAYVEEVRRFLASRRHARLGRPFRDLAYLPMVELIAYLEDHDFRVHIVTGGELGFARTVAEEIYGVPVENVVASAVRYRFRENAAGGEIIRGKLLLFNDEAGKPANIQLHVGRRPILAFGNSDGDVEMLEFAAGSAHPSLSLVLRHDDAEREYAYDDRTEEVRARARRRGWTVVSMRDDFATVFAPPGG